MSGPWTSIQRQSPSCCCQGGPPVKLYLKMLESRPEDVLVKLANTVEIVETVDFGLGQVAWFFQTTSRLVGMFMPCFMILVDTSQT